MRRYNQFMKDVRPSDPFRSKLEAEMNRELRQQRRIRKAMPRRLAVAAAAALTVLALAGLYFARPSRPDRQQSPVVAPGNVQSAPTAAPSVTPESSAVPPAVNTGLEMLDETIHVVWNDVNLTFGCHLLVNEAVGVFNENEAIKLSPGVAYWTLITEEEPLDENMTFIQWWDEETASLRTGWADPPFKTDEPSPLETLGIPGRVRAENVVMRIGPDFRAPENAWLSEGQYVHLFAQRNGWIFASTAPFDQPDEGYTLPLCGWIYAGDLWGLRYVGQEASEIPDGQGTVVPAEYPPEDEPWGLEIVAEGVWPTESTTHITTKGYQSALMFENYLVGGGSEADYVYIYESADGGATLAELHPGDAYWPVKGVDMQIIYDEKGENVGFAEQVMWLGDDNFLHTGWKRKVYSDTPPKQAKENPVETLARPGRIRADGTALRYGRSAEAPAVAVLEEGRVLGLQAKVGNWVYASTELFRRDGEQPVTGWVHVTEVVGLHWNISINHIDLTVDKANVRAAPDGEIIGAVTKNDASAGSLLYQGATVPGKEGDWHYVSLNGFDFKEGAIDGYIFADLTKLHTFPLSYELPMENVVSATLAYAPTEDYPDVQPRGQTIEGEKLDRLLERMGGAVSEAVHTPVCGDGVATITLKYADGSEEITYLAADSCIRLRYGDVTYNLRTKEEIAEGFLQAGGVSLKEILGSVFDQIAFP